MARTNNLTNFLTDVADAIRSKTGGSSNIACENFDTEIGNIPTGGNLQSSKSATITTNTTTVIEPDTGYDGMESVSVTTVVPSPGDPTKGVVITSWTNDGYPEEMRIVGHTTIPYQYCSGSFFQLVKIITLPTDITQIDNSAFYNEASLQSINLKDCSQLVTIKQSAFEGVRNANLTKIPDSVANLETNAFKGCQAATFSTIPPLVRQILQGCFQGCSNATFSTFPENVTSIGDYAFAYCSEATFSTLPSTLSRTGIGSYAFQNCSKITISKIPDSVTDAQLIGAFQNCTSITKMDLNNNKNAYTYTFNGCTGLISVLMPNVTTVIGGNATNGAFYNCTALKAVWIGDKITSSGMGRYVFRNCTSVIKIYINKPRATVEAFTNYQYAFSSINTSTQTLSTSVIVCNDDQDWMTKEQFDAADWETYTP